MPDARLLEATIDAIVLDRPEPEPDFPQHLCPDKGYDNSPRGGAPAKKAENYLRYGKPRQDLGYK